MRALRGVHKGEGNRVSGGRAKMELSGSESSGLEKSPKGAFPDAPGREDPPSCRYAGRHDWSVCLYVLLRQVLAADREQASHWAVHEYINVVCGAADGGGGGLGEPAGDRPRAASQRLQRIPKEPDGLLHAEAGGD